jgi:hypothetical protein
MDKVKKFLFGKSQTKVQPQTGVVSAQTAQHNQNSKHRNQHNKATAQNKNHGTAKITFVPS